MGAMIFLYRLARWLVLAFALSACSSTPPPDPVATMSWDYAADAVMLEIIASPGLNTDDGQAHTLLLGIYQMADAQAFRDLAADPAALAGTMASGKAAPAFLQFSRYVVTPGQHSWLILDRAQNARSVGIVAGYTRLAAAGAARQFDVPVVTETSGYLFKTHTARPLPLVVRLNLGTQGVVNAVTLAQGLKPADLVRARQLEGGGKEIRLDGNGADSLRDPSLPPTARPKN